MWCHLPRSAWKLKRQVNLLPRMPRKSGFCLLLKRQSQFANEFILLAIMIKPPLLNLALQACHSCGSISSTIPPCTNFRLWLPEPTVTFCLFSGLPMPFVLSQRKALKKCLVKRRYQDDVCPTTPGANLCFSPTKAFLAALSYPAQNF